MGANNQISIDGQTFTFEALSGQNSFIINFDKTKGISEELKKQLIEYYNNLFKDQNLEVGEFNIDDASGKIKVTLKKIQFDYEGLSKEEIDKALQEELIKQYKENADGTKTFDYIYSEELTINATITKTGFKLQFPEGTTQEQMQKAVEEWAESFGQKADGISYDTENFSVEFGITPKINEEQTDTSKIIELITSIKDLLSGEEGIKLSFDTSTGLEEAENSITTWLEGIKALLSNIPITFSPTGLGGGEGKEGIIPQNLGYGQNTTSNMFSIPVNIIPIITDNYFDYLLHGKQGFLEGQWEPAKIPVLIDPQIAEDNPLSTLFGGEGENNLETNEITQQLTTFITEIAEALNSIDFSTVSNALMDVCTQIQNVANNFNAIQAAGDIFASITSGALAAYFPLYMIWYSLINTVTQLDQIKNHQALQEMSKDATEAMDSIMGIDGAVEDLRTAFQIFREENPFLFGDQEEKSKIDILFNPIIDPNNPLAPYLGGTSENPFATTEIGGITIPINPVIAEDNPLIAFFGVGGTTEDSGNAISTMIQNVANSLSSIDASGIKEVSKAIDDLGSRQ